MLQLKNHTPFQPAIAAFPNPQGVQCVYAVVKGTFSIRKPSGIEVASPQPPVVPTDEHWDDPAATSIKCPGEVSLLKPSTDILLLGHAYPSAVSQTVCEVGLRVGPVQKVVRVFGDRIWKWGLLGHRMTEPEPFQKMPLKWELAFGGTDSHPKKPDRADHDPRNPVGRGLAFKHSQLPTHDMPLPNLEDPEHLIRRPGDKPPPACFAPVAAHWEPRKLYAGTYDEAWLKKRAPYLPDDFDPRHLQIAPPGLIAPEYLKGGEPVEIVGAAPGGPLRFDLPTCSMELIFRLDGREIVQAPVLDTVIFQPDEMRFCLLWRACQVVDKKLLRLSEVEINCREYALRKVA